LNPPREVCKIDTYQIIQTTFSDKFFGRLPAAGANRAPPAATRRVAMEATVAERGQITLPKAVRDALGLTKGTKLKVELEGGRIVLRKDVDDAISRLRGRVKLPPGVTTDDVMRELRGRAPGDPYPPPDDGKR
jgi:AbrB family looped-hinge helix DNA binding protein